MVRQTRATYALALFIGAVIGTLGAGTPAAHAQQGVCAERAEVLAHLSGAYKESPVAMGLANNGGVIEVLRSDDRKTFTILITMPDGVSCMIAAGESWENLPQQLVRGPKI